MAFIARLLVNQRVQKTAAGVIESACLVILPFRLRVKTSFLGDRKVSLSKSFRVIFGKGFNPGDGNKGWYLSGGW